MNRQQNPKTELMSPAGYWPELKAAVQAGADAVYFGLTDFSARAKVGFRPNELPEVMAFLHEHGAKGYVTFNTVVFDSELPSAIERIQAIIESGVDALIVQDVGIAELIHRVCPEMPLHGSTQMTITSAQGAEFAKQLGCSRVVLARELSLDDIRKIRSETEVELEAFVHGALCVSYSGQCFSSEAWGGRSANRGQCAQACRLSYSLEVDGKPTDLGAARYLLSPGDLMTLDHVRALVDCGVSCLKIEGRYKDAEYVAMTTMAYRKALDAALAETEYEANDSEILELEQIYSRGLGDYFLSGTNHQRVVLGRAPRHRGVRLGTVVKVLRDSVIVECQIAPKRGDGIVFDAADRRSPDGDEPGGFVYDALVDGENRYRLWFQREALDVGQIEPGDWVWRSLDPQIEKKARQSLRSLDQSRGIEVTLRVKARVGKPLEIEAVADGVQEKTIGQQPLEAAKKKATDRDLIVQQLGRLGDTSFQLIECDVAIDENVFVPASMLNQARRELTEKLMHRLQQLTPRTLTEQQKAEFVSLATRKQSNLDSQTPDSRLHLLVRTPEQLAGAIEVRPDSITLDYLELYGLRDSVERIKSAGIEARVASPRILKPSEQKVIRFLLSLECSILARSSGLLHELFQTDERTLPATDGDFSLNIANQFTAQTYEKLGLRRLTPSYDLNASQINDLCQTVAPNRLELVVLHHLPVFHTEHCVFCRFMSEGTDNTNCGHPCEKHSIVLRDSSGRKHPVMADVGCRNTVFNAEMQSATPWLPSFLNSKIQHFRLEFVHQSKAQVIETSRAMKEFLTGKISSQDLHSRWTRQTPSGLSEGSLFVPKNLVPLKG
ncbi:MAG: U32 family peptidase [Pirellulaceae bacterium]